MVTIYIYILAAEIPSIYLTITSMVQVAMVVLSTQIYFFHLQSVTIMSCAGAPRALAVEIAIITQRIFPVYFMLGLNDAVPNRTFNQKRYRFSIPNSIIST